MSAPGELRALVGDRAARRGRRSRNVAPVHLEFFASLDAIARAKAEILEGLRPGGAAVLNADDPRLRRDRRALAGRVVWFGRDRALRRLGRELARHRHGMRFDLRIGGPRARRRAAARRARTTSTNFLAAAAAAHAARHRARGDRRGAPRACAPARHRGEVLRARRRRDPPRRLLQLEPAAVEAAVVALGLAPGRRRVAFLGDMLELGRRAGRCTAQAGRARCAGRVDVLVGVGPLARAGRRGRARGRACRTALRCTSPTPPRAGGRGREPGRSRATRCWSRARAACAWSGWWRRSCARFGRGARLSRCSTTCSTRLRRELSALNVVRYITFRTAVASLTALFLVLLLGPWMIERLRAAADRPVHPRGGPAGAQGKAGTPTMGGVLILAASWCRRCSGPTSPTATSGS